MNITILDCYTDEPAGLGVPPFLGTYARYIYGKFAKEHNVQYITIDDMRAFVSGIEDDVRVKENQKTDIKTYNRTKTNEQVRVILANTSQLVIIAGIHTPGKYLSAVPGTLSEINTLVKELKCEKILTGPAVYGSGDEGGKMASMSGMDKWEIDFPYKEIKDYAIEGAELVNHIPYEIIAEIETSKGCPRSSGCSFCTEPIKNKLEFRDKEDIVEEIHELYNNGVIHFRLGKQSCFYSYPDAIDLLKEIRRLCPGIKTLHIDNVNPEKVVSQRGEKITQAIVENCSAGNVASFGVESFDDRVVSANNLNSDAETTYNAIEVINNLGREIGDNGMPKFLPGINLLFGLKEESKESHNENMKWLNKIMTDGLLFRRINIRQVNVFPGTELFESVKNKFIKKNKAQYWKWRDEIRHKIDLQMIQKVIPAGSVLKDVKTEIYDGKTTFARQIGTYPIAIGISGRLELKKHYDVRIKSHMLRSVVGEII